MTRQRHQAILVIAAFIAAGSVGSLMWLSAAPTTAQAPSEASDPVVRPTVPQNLDGRALLNASLETPTGQSVHLADLAAGRPIIVNFWASWCAPCIAEMPLLDRVASKRTDVRLVGVNELDDQTAARAMAKRTKITYPWLLDADGSSGATAEVVNLPTTLLIRPDGKITASRIGAFKSARDLQRWISAGTR